MDTYFFAVRYNDCKDILITHHRTGRSVSGLQPLFHLGEGFFEDAWAEGNYLLGRTKPRYEMPVVIETKSTH